MAPPPLSVRPVEDARGSSALVRTLLADAELERLTSHACHRQGDCHADDPARTKLAIGRVRFVEQRGGPVVLSHGSVVEGSTPHGGMQPNYVIDLEDPRFERILAATKLLRDKPMPFWDKVDRVRGFVRALLPAKAYAAPSYLELLRSLRREEANATLGDYVDCACGVCREHALFTHFALKAAGIPNEYLYARATQGRRVEDHAVNLVLHGGERWVVDSYNRNFHGARLADLERPGGSRRRDRWAPGADPAMLGCSLRRTDYPTYWMPVNSRG